MVVYSCPSWLLQLNTTNAESTGRAKRDTSRRPFLPLSTHTSYLKRDYHYADECEKTKNGAQEGPPAVDPQANVGSMCALRKQVTSHLLLQQVDKKVLCSISVHSLHI